MKTIARYDLIGWLYAISGNQRKQISVLKGARLLEEEKKEQYLWSSREVHIYEL